MPKKLLNLLLVCVLMAGIVPVHTHAAANEAAKSDIRSILVNAEAVNSEETAALRESPLLSGAVATDVGDNSFVEAESNNSIHDANILESDYTVTGTLADYDRDYYTFDLTKASEITVISMATTRNLTFGLLDDTGEILLGVGLDLGYESDLYGDGLVCKLVAGTYHLVFLEADTHSADYLFYFEYAATNESHSHSYFPTVYEPGCESEGYTVYNCSCGSSYTADRVAALGHEIDPTSYWFYGTGTTVMEHRYSCLFCNSSIKEPCDLRGTVVTEATIDQPGTTQYTCTKCTASYTDYTPYRIYGETRYETAFAAADILKAKLGVEKFDTIIIANGTNFADALSGSYLAAVKNAPILLYQAKQVSSIQEYISRNLTADGTVYLLGGVNAIPAALESALAGYTVERLWGATRYETNLEILKEAGVAGQEILICTGSSFADSLSASAAKKPILLVSGSLTSGQKEFLNSSSGKLVIIGGVNAISAELEAELEAFGTTERLGGATRYQTSIMVADRFFDNPGAAVLAYSLNFPDGLCGGPLAVSMNAPMILTATGSEAAAAQYAKDKGISHGVVLGGPILISDQTAKSIFNYTDTAEKSEE